MSELPDKLDDNFLADFPNLTKENHDVTSPKTLDYNCVAHALGRDDEFIWPFATRQARYIGWPETPQRKPHVSVIAGLFQSEGYVACDTPEFETATEKVAIYVKSEDGVSCTHVARQLESGYWTSKLGADEDITHHTLESLERSDYGQVAMILKRKK